jgi:hypothetical protein
METKMNVMTESADTAPVAVRELRLDEVEEVSGGMLPLLVLADAAIFGIVVVSTGIVLGVAVGLAIERIKK